MSMAGYTKLFNSILASTIWREDDKTRIVWITLLAMADKNGVAEGSVPGLADLARVTIPECEASLTKLMSADAYSRTTDHEGKRIAKVEGGWAILNHAKYRAKMNLDERREYNRIKQKEFRQKKASTRRQQKSITVIDCNGASALSAHAEASPDAKAVNPSGYSVPSCFEKIDGFTTALAGWIEHRKKIKRPATGRAVQLLINKLAERPEDAIRALDATVMNGWQSFEWHYLDKNGNGTNGHRLTFKEEAQQREEELHKKESKYGF